MMCKIGITILQIVFAFKDPVCNTDHTFSL